MLEVIESAVKGWITLAFCGRRIAIKEGDRILVYAKGDELVFVDFADYVERRDT